VAVLRFADDALDSVDKLDLTSEPQLYMLFTLYKYKYPVQVQYGCGQLLAQLLCASVLPRETMQFPNRLWPTRSTRLGIPQAR
jgi:hypothetical protein